MGDTFSKSDDKCNCQLVIRTFSKSDDKCNCQLVIRLRKDLQVIILSFYSGLLELVGVA